jgi:hypothetical protein
MNARSLLEDLRRRGVLLEANGERLHVDAPVGAIPEELRSALTEHKPRLLRLLEWERRKLEEADRLGLLVRWSKEPGWIALHDPTIGEWHEVKASECLPSVVESARANDRRKSKVRTR